MNDRTVPVADLVRRARSGDWTVAEDVAQDAFVSAFGRRPPNRH